MTSTRFFVRFFYATFFLLVCMAPQALFAQQKVFNFNVVPAAEAEGMQVYVSSLNLGKEGKTGEAKLQAGKFVVSLDFSNTELYNVVIIKNNVQNILPFYSGAREKVANVDVKCENNRVVVSDNSVNNKALFAFNEVLMQKGMALWSGIALTTEQQKQFIASYKTAADSIVAHYKCSPTVKKYIEINGYTSAYNAYTSLPRALKIKRSEVAFEIEDVLPHPGEVLDHALTGLFPVGKHIMVTNIPKGTLCERLKFVNERYKNVALKKQLVASLAESFVTNTSAAANYETGFAELKTAVEQYGVDEKYLAQYAKLRNVIPGSLFPADVTLEDINGNKVDFSQFKGKYVYIDLWASWCGPCVQEIPHLQALEKEFEGGNVVFVSISVDTNKEAWKSKVAALGLHGHQFVDAGGKLASALNVQGIPHFLIYDKEGKLHTYKAMRPSSGDAIKKILKNFN